MLDLIKGTYADNECIFLLQNMNKKIVPLSLNEKKELMNSGKKSYEIIPHEYIVDSFSENLFLRILSETKEKMAKCVGKLAESIYSVKGEKIVLVSLARGGVPVGVLCKKYLNKFYKIDVPHYVISLIRNEGIDVAALSYIISAHPDGKIQFLDGWTGMGYISNQLKKYVSLYNKEFNQKIDYELGVLVDSSKICKYFGTREDTIFPGCCLNATVCGMISSIFYDKNMINQNEFHGAIQWDSSIGKDYSNHLVETISNCFLKEEGVDIPVQQNYVEQCVDIVSRDLKIKNMKNIKFGIGESARAIIRYELDCLLIKNLNNPDLQFLIEIANTKNTRIICYDKTDYECIAVISEKEVF